MIVQIARQLIPPLHILCAYGPKLLENVLLDINLADFVVFEFFISSFFVQVIVV